MKYTATNKNGNKMENFTEEETNNWHPFGLAGEVFRSAIKMLESDKAIVSVDCILGWKVIRA